MQKADSGTPTEDDIFMVLRGASFIEMFLLCTEHLELGQDLVLDNLELLEKYGWDPGEFRIAFLQSNLSLNHSAITDTVWREKLRESDTEGVRACNRKV